MLYFIIHLAPTEIRECHDGQPQALLSDRGRRNDPGYALHIPRVGQNLALEILRSCNSDTNHYHYHYHYHEIIRIIIECDYQ